MRYATAITARGGVSWATGSRDDLPPLLHAITLPPPRHSRTGQTFTAACGTQVRTVDEARPFPAEAGRACSKCRRIAWSQSPDTGTRAPQSAADTTGVPYAPQP